MATQVNGKSAHHNWYVGVGSFPKTATLEFGGGPNNVPANPWHENAEGHTFYIKVLGQQPKTVQAAIDLGNSVLGLKPRQVINHLRWLYTWHPHTFLKVDGMHFDPANPTSHFAVAKAVSVVPTATAQAPAQSAPQGQATKPQAKKSK